MFTHRLFILPWFVVFLAIFNILFYFPVTSNQPASSANSSVLGTSATNPTIGISNTRDGFKTGGILNQSSLDEPAVSLYPYDSTGVAVVEIYSAGISDVLNFLTHDKEGKQLSNFDYSALTKITSLTSSVTANKDNRLLLPISGEGIWFLKVNYGEGENSAFLIRSDIGAVAKKTDTKMNIWVQSLISKKTIYTGTITVYSLLNSPKLINKSNIEPTGITVVLMAPTGNDVAFISSGSHLALVPLNLRYLNYSSVSDSFSTSLPTFRFFSFTDKPLYRPGDTVNFKSILRNDSDAFYKIPTSKIKVQAFKDWNRDTAFFETTLPVSEQGSVTGQFVLPVTEGPGNFQILFTSETINSVSTGQNKAFFRVENFREPEYAIDISSAQNEFILGDTAKFTIMGNYFSGAPLAGAEIAYKISASDYIESEYPPDASVDKSLTSYTYGFWNGTEIKSGTIKLDSIGQVNFPLPLTKPTFSFSTPKVLSVDISYKDSSGYPVLSRKNILVYPGQFSLYRDNNFYSGQVSRAYTLPIVPKSREGTLVRDVRLTAKVHRESWIAGSATYVKEEEDFPSISSVTSQFGQAVFTFTPNKTGSYKFTVSGTDKLGNIITKDFYAWISEYDRPAPLNPVFQNLRLEADKKSYLVGEQPVLKIWSDIPDRDILLSFDRGVEKRSQIIKLSGNSQIFPVKLNDTDIPNVFASLSSFSDSSLDTDSQNLTLNSSAKKLIIKLSPDLSRYAPGQNVVLNLETTDVSGRPVPAEVALWVIDKTIFELSDTNFSNVFNNFWQTRSNTTSISDSLSPIDVNINEALPVENKYPEVSSVIKDTAYWNPRVITGTDGKSRVSFKLPANLTTWTISALGSSLDTRVGQASSEITVSKEVIIRPLVPNILRVGDTIHLSAIVHNFTNSVQKFKVSLVFDSGTISSNSTASNLLISPNQSRQVDWTISPTKINSSAKLTFTASAESGKSDSVVSTLPVKSSAFDHIQTRTASGSAEFSLNIPKDTDLSNSSITLSLSPNILGTIPSAINYLLSYPYDSVEQITGKLVSALITKSNLDLFYDSVSQKEIDSTFKSGFEKLSSLRSSDGGWNWWWPSDKSDIYMTFSVLEVLLKAKTAGIEVPDGLINPALSYLKAQNSLTNNQKVFQTYIINLSGTENPIPVSDYSGLSDTSLAVAVISNSLIGDSNPDTNGLSILNSRSKTINDTVFWEADSTSAFPSKEASTALVIRAIIAGNGDRNIAFKAADFLLANKHDIFWADTYATSQIIQAVTALYNSGNNSDPNYSYKIFSGDKTFFSGNVTSATQFIKDIPIPIKDFVSNQGKLSVTFSGTGNLFSTLVEKYRRTDSKAAPVSNTINISREYTNSKGKDYSIGVGDIVTVMLTVNGIPENSNYLVVEDWLPSGLVPISSYSTGLYTADYTYVEYQSDGAVLSRYIASGTSTLSYEARVISSGEFAVPPATAQLMYRPEINARSENARLTVNSTSAVPLLSQLPQQITTDLKSPSSYLRIIGIVLFSSLILIPAILVIISKKRKRLQ